MKQHEMKVSEKVGQINAFGVQLEEPMQKESVARTREMKPLGFPEDSRGYWLAS